MSAAADPASTPRVEQPTHDGRLHLVASGGRLLHWFTAVVVMVVVAEVAARGAVDRTVDEIRWYDAAAQQRVELLDERGDDVEVVFAGTSAAWQAFVPAEFEAATGLDSVNVGLGGAVPTVMAPWLTEEVVPRSSPDLVVWGLTSLDFAPAYGHLQAAAYGDAVETADGWLAELDRSVSSVSTLVSARRLLRSPSALFGSEEDQRSRDLTGAAGITGPDGERVDFGAEVTPESLAIQRSRLAGFEIDAEDVGAITSAIRSLQAQGTTVVLVEVPVPDRFVDQLPRPSIDVAATRTAIAEIGAATSSDVILLGEVFGDTNFVDDIHLGANAAAQATKWLAEILGALTANAATGDSGDCATVEVVDAVGFVVPVQVCRNASSR